MATLQITLTGSKTKFRPGEQVKGRATWRLDKDEELEICLLWHTQGKGFSDVEVVQREHLGQAGQFGERDFTFTLPASPYSFSGKLISLMWAIELVTLSSEETSRVDIVVSPTAEECVLHPQEKQ